MSTQNLTKEFPKSPTSKGSVNPENRDSLWLCCSPYWVTQVFSVELHFPRDEGMQPYVQPLSRGFLNKINILQKDKAEIVACLQSCLQRVENWRGVRGVYHVQNQDSENSICFRAFSNGKKKTRQNLQVDCWRKTRENAWRSVCAIVYIEIKYETCSYVQIGLK